MLAASTLTQSAITSTLLQLSTVHSSEELAQVLPLLSSQFVVDAILEKDDHYLSSVLGMPEYTSESALWDVFRGEWKSVGGRAELHVDGAVAWGERDDVLGTVLRTAAGRAQQKYTPLQGFRSSTSDGYDSLADLPLFYAKFNRTAFENRVLPYVTVHHADYAGKYNAAMEALSDVLPPGQCLPAQMPLWGRLANVLGDLFAEWRRALHPPIVQSDEEIPPGPDNIMDLLTVTGHPGHYGRPFQGERFQGWELSLIEQRQLGGQGATVVDVGENQYLKVPSIYDAFTTIGSRWITIRPLPELTPLQELGPPDDEEEEDEEQEGACAFPNPTPAHEALVPPPLHRSRGAPRDEYTWLRDAIKQYALSVIDLNANHALLPLRDGATGIRRKESYWIPIFRGLDEPGHRITTLPASIVEN